MITDDQKVIRELGKHCILQAIFEQYWLHKLSVPVLPFSAADYICFIDLQSKEIAEQPLFADNSEDDIEMLVTSGDIPVVNFQKYPCHTQAVEWCVKLVTEASAAVCGLH